CLVQRRRHLPISPHVRVSERNLLVEEMIPGIELESPSMIANRFFPAPLSPINVSSYLVKTRAVRQCLPCFLQLRSRTIVVEFDSVNVLCHCKMSFTGFGPEANCCF